MSDREYTPEEIEAALNGEDIEETPETTEEASEEEATPSEEAVEDTTEAETPQPVNEDVDEGKGEVEDDWQEKYRKLQSAKDREMAEMQKQIQQLREEQAEVRGRDAARQEYQEQQGYEQLASVRPEDLQYGIETDLPSTFQWTVINRPDLVPSLISRVRATGGLGHEVADQMVIEYQGYLHQQALQSQQQLRDELKEEKEAERAPLERQQAMENVVSRLTERFGETFVQVQDEISKRLETDGREYIMYLQNEAAKNGEEFEVTPSLVHDMMVDIYLELREQAFNEQSMAPQKPSAVDPNANALGQSAHQETPPDEEDFLAGFISGARGADINIDPKFLP